MMIAKFFINNKQNYVNQQLTIYLKKNIFKLK